MSRPARTKLIHSSKIRKRGGTYYMKIDPDLVEKLELEHGTDVQQMYEEGPEGPYMSAWNPEQQVQSKNRE